MTTKTITIEVKGDRNKEANETFYLDLFGLSTNALFTKTRGIGTIVNDDCGLAIPGVRSTSPLGFFPGCPQLTATAFAFFGE